MRSPVRHRCDKSRGNRSNFTRSPHPAVIVVSPRIGEHGRAFANVDAYPVAEVDPLYGSEHVEDLYLKAEPAYSWRFIRFIMLSSSQ